jgi:hypothetical protein
MVSWKRLQVGLMIFPDQFGLNQGNFQILHNISAACSRVWSLLAKQNRNTRLSCRS